MDKVFNTMLESTLWYFRITPKDSIPAKLVCAVVNTGIRLASIVALIVAVRFALACPVPFL